MATRSPTTGQRFSLGYQDLIGITLGSLYDSFSFPSLAELLAVLEAAAAPTALGSLLADLSSRTGGLVNKRGFPHYQNFAEAFPAARARTPPTPAPLTQTGSWTALTPDNWALVRRVSGFTWRAG